MSEVIEKLQYLVKASDKVLTNPSIPISKSIGIERNANTKEWVYTDGVKLLRGSAAMVGVAAIAGPTALSGFGLTIAGLAAGTGATISGLSATGVGVAVAPIVLIGSIWKYKKEKQKKEEKERLYREIIKKQQATIHRLQEISLKLEVEKRKLNHNKTQMQTEISDLYNQKNNLQDWLEVLSEQIKQTNIK